MENADQAYRLGDAGSFATVNPSMPATVAGQM
jgi:hypothetical protein